MRTTMPVTMRRWDGKLKEATVWDCLEKDLDLFTINGNCFVYLSRQHVNAHQPLACLQFEQLVFSKCLPLIEKVDTPDYFPMEAGSDPSVPSTAATKKQHCVLCLEAPQLHDMDAVKQYNVTTRNFLAWIMNKPIVGPDPSSSLLALKLRMDVWRSSSVDNMSDLYQYARAQGYGDLGDMQLFLSNHLRGVSTVPSDYKLIAAPEPILETEEDVVKLGFRKSIRKRLSSFVKRRPTSEENGDNFEVIDTPPVSIVQAESALMSGAVSPADEIDASAIPPLPPLSARDMYSERQSAIGKASPPAKTPSILNPRLKQASRRTYSMPALPRDSSIEDLSRELEKQSLWIHNLTKEHFEQSANRSTSSSPALTDAFSAPLNASVPSASTKPGQSLSRMASHRKRSSLSRPPSPIQEEESSSVSDAPASSKVPSKQNTRRFSTSAVGTVSSLYGGNSIVVKPLSILKKPLGNHPYSKPSLSASETNIGASTSKKCVHSLLPSHTRFPCKSCGKPKLSKAIEAEAQPQARDVASGPSDKPERYKLSLEFEGMQDGLKFDLPPDEDLKVKSAPAGTLADQVRALTRFPSLRRSRTSSSTRASQALSEGSASASENQIPSFYSTRSRANLSMPDLGYRQSEKAVSSKAPSQLQPIQAVQNHKDSSLPTAATDNRFWRTRSAEASEAVQPSSSTSMSSTNPKYTVELTDSPGDSATELPSPLTPKSPHQQLMSLSVSGENNTASPLTRLKAQGGSEGLLSVMLADPQAIDGHRVPLDEMILSTKDTRVIDNMLADMISVSSQDNSPRWSRISIDESAEKQTSSFVNIVTHEVNNFAYPGNDQIVKKKGLRTSLRLWTSRKAKQEQPIQALSQYQANVLVLDSSGSFSTLVSPVDNVKYEWEKQLQDRSATPMCELPADRP